NRSRHRRTKSERPGVWLTTHLAAARIIQRIASHDGRHRTIEMFDDDFGVGPRMLRIEPCKCNGLAHCVAKVGRGSVTNYLTVSAQHRGTGARRTEWEDRRHCHHLTIGCRWLGQRLVTQIISFDFRDRESKACLVWTVLPSHVCTIGPEPFY